MNDFEVIEASSSVVVVTVAFNLVLWKSATLEVAILAKKRMRE